MNLQSGEERVTLNGALLLNDMWTPVPVSISLNQISALKDDFFAKLVPRYTTEARHVFL